VAFSFKQWGAWAPQRWLPNAKVYEFEKASDYFTKMYKVGKKRAGRLLGGREWNQFPEVK
jgi:hypothetical protein